MTKIVITAIVTATVFLLCGSFWLFASETQKDKIAAAINSGSIERQCFALQKKILRDPDTAYLVDSDLTSTAIAITYRAKNGFGAYNTTTFECPLRVDGSINELQVALNRL